VQLKELLEVLSCPFKYQHTAGNDANFKLRALFMIAVKDSQETARDGSQRALLAALQAIAQPTKPNSMTWLDKPAKEDWMKEQEARFGILEERQRKNQ
jgi:hypothetical protein